MASLLDLGSSTENPDLEGYPIVLSPQVLLGVSVIDNVTGYPSPAQPTAYSGPVAGLTNEFISPTPDSLSIAAMTPGWFIKGGAGNDAITVSSGTNVIDGGGGSNFLTGGSGFDTFFVDDHTPSADIWSTIANCHAGDNITIYGVDSSDFALSWVNGQGAAGYTGLTLHCTAAGKPTASMTLVGFTSADMTSGRVAVSFGTDPAAGAYMNIHIAS
jgi:Ca2+-binding RTX toxin-like protein